MRERGRTAGAPRWAVPTTGSRLGCVPSVMLNTRVGQGTLGLLAPDPRQRAFGSLDSHSGGSGRVGGPARGGRAGLAGVTARIRARRDAEPAGLPLSVTACAVTPSPPGKGAGLVALGRDSPTVAPLRVRVVRSALVERGGDLLRRPTEATPAPPAMHRCGEPYRFRPVPPCQPTSRGTPDRPTTQRATRAARRCRPAASGQQA